jgi:hypothetical protein
MSDARGARAQVKYWQEEHRAMYVQHLHNDTGLLHTAQLPTATAHDLYMHNNAVEHLMMYDAYWDKHREELLAFGIDHFYTHHYGPGSTQRSWAYEDENNKQRAADEWRVYVREEHAREEAAGQTDTEWRKRDRRFKTEDRKAAREAAQALLMLGNRDRLPRDAW